MSRQAYDRLRLALSVAGLAIAGYLTLQHYDSSVPLVCGGGGSVINCETVLTSPSATALGVPVAVWGLLWFGVALAIAVLVHRAAAAGSAERVRQAALLWTLVGTATVFWLVFQELGVVGKICAWCTAIHVIVLALLVVEVRSHGTHDAATGPS